MAYAADKKQLNIWVSDPERETLKRRAAAAGISLQKYCTQMLLNGKLEKKHEEK